ncbi:MAG: hypothetical protein PHG25_02000 [Candidatus Pacebacteria bacterium]|nr:hypothetical protein [Candidatus Paceibacterota bacterium]
MIKYLLISIVIVASISAYIWHISVVPLRFELYVFNTKGKPAIFIRTPQDERVLINGGANSDAIRYITKVIPFYSRRIDMVVLTNDDANNVTGLIDVINRYKVGSIIIPAITTRSLGLASSTDEIYETFMNTVSASHIPIKEVKMGDTIEHSHFKVDVLFPALDSEDVASMHSTTSKQFSYSKASVPELVLKITYGRTAFLLIGDVSTKIQKFIAKASPMANVLIIPHSASASALSLDLVNAVQPEFIVYTQAITSAQSSSKISSRVSKIKNVDPLYMILDDHRLNLKQKNTIRVLSDGESVEVR